MQPIPEAEALCEQVQRNHVVHVEAELDLTATSLGVSETEFGIGEEGAGAQSLMHARQALEGARLGIQRISSTQERSRLLTRYENIKTKVREFAAKVGPL